MISVNVSLGELLDKYSILEIKKSRISDPVKVSHVENEMTELKSQVDQYIYNHPYGMYYAFLKDINETIWDLSDHIRDNPQDTKACMDIIHHNDRRFRVKNKINIKSVLKEQKSYPHKKIGLYVPEGMDPSVVNGSIRYYSTVYDEVYVSGYTLERYLDDICIKPGSYDETITVSRDTYNEVYDM